jgi:AAA+ superfamily predicted ATPase
MDETLFGSADDFGSGTKSQLRQLDAAAASPEKSDDDYKKVKRVQWSQVGPGQFVGCGRTLEKLYPQIYSIGELRGEALFINRNTTVDELMEFPDSKTDKIITEIEDFWAREELFKQFGFLHRRGYLLYGPAGSGKTSLVQQIIARIIQKQGTVFLCEHPALFLEGLQTFREVEPNRPVVCIFEDIDAIIAKYGEDTLLSVLDGENQIDKVLNIATTNYPEKLDKRIISRPRRFDRVIRIGMPSSEIRAAYFSKKLGIQDNELKQWVNVTDDFSFAAMSELVISVKCLGHSFEHATDTLRALLSKKKHEFIVEEKPEMKTKGVV